MISQTKNSFKNLSLKNVNQNFSLMSINVFNVALVVMVYPQIDIKLNSEQKLYACIILPDTVKKPSLWPT